MYTHLLRIHFCHIFHFCGDNVFVLRDVSVAGWQATLEIYIYIYIYDLLNKSVIFVHTVKVYKL